MPLEKQQQFRLFAGYNNIAFAMIFPDDKNLLKYLSIHSKEFYLEKSGLDVENSITVLNQMSNKLAQLCERKIERINYKEFNVDSQEELISYWFIMIHVLTHNKAIKEEKGKNGFWIEISE